ncbi:MAG: acetamidase/formamidase family protein [Clostridiales bacterium]|nr:acetamidase/formamidase family protein [Clostridiales bacterium]
MITKDNIFYSFSKDNVAVKIVRPKETVIIETIDAFGGQITSEDDQLDTLNWNQVNPATGPIYIEGAEPGDFLKVEINGIEIDASGVMASIPDAGIFGSLHKKSSVKCFDIYDGYTEFNDMAIPIHPMIGVIGVAPSSKSISNGEPGPHGGNMDNKMISTGTILYLPVFVKGALFGLGDLHAAMGDGESNVTGIEIGGKVTVTFDIIKEKSHGHPIMTKNGQFYTIYSCKTLDEAVEKAAYEMHYWVKKSLGYNDSDAAMLISIMADSEICQVVDPKKTARMKMPQLYFRYLNL